MKPPSVAVPTSSTAAAVSCSGTPVKFGIITILTGNAQITASQSVTNGAKAAEAALLDRTEARVHVDLAYGDAVDPVVAVEPGDRVERVGEHVNVRRHPLGAEAIAPASPLMVARMRAVQAPEEFPCRTKTKGESCAAMFKLYQRSHRLRR